MPNNSNVIAAFKNFCSYIIRYRADNLYQNLNNHNFGGYKKRKEVYKTLFDISKVELEVNTFKQFFIPIIKYFDYDDENVALIFSRDNINLVQDFIDFGMEKVGNNMSNKLDSIEIEFLVKFIDTSSSKYDDAAIVNETVFVSQTQPPRILRSHSSNNQHIPSSQQAEAILNNLNLDVFSQSSQNDNNNLSTNNNNSPANNSSVNISSANFVKLLEKTVRDIFLTSFKEQVGTSIHDNLASELNKHLGINRNLTSEDIERYQLKLAYTWNQYLRKENSIKNIQTHLEQHTAPFELRYLNFPVPLLPHDQIFVDIWNNLIYKWREEALIAYKKRLEEQKKLFENDFSIIKDILKNHIDNIDNFVLVIKQNEEKILKNEFDAINKKTLDAKINPHKNESKYKVKIKNKQMANSNNSDTSNNNNNSDKISIIKKSKRSNKQESKHSNNKKNVTINLSNQSSSSAISSKTKSKFNNNIESDIRFNNTSNIKNNNGNNYVKRNSNNFNNRNSRFNQTSRRNYIRKSTSVSGSTVNTGRAFSRDNQHFSAQPSNRNHFLANTRHLNSYG